MYVLQSKRSSFEAGFKWFSSRDLLCLEKKHSLQYMLLQCLSVVQAPMTEAAMWAETPSSLSPMDAVYDILDILYLWYM